ncbi:phosphatase PAP2 family protein [Novosphingobium sp. HR1a]|nr:phosphatase PAP2 family protein [Novosphingobium sp. HR1a]MBF7014494.1 phosphatase PAP2 family protein [Novosphingobium sp. HR1a]
MRKAMLLTLAAIALVAAKEGPQQPLLLTPGDVDPSLLLPPPPAKDSAQGRSELEQLHRVDQTRTTADADNATALGKIKDVSVFAAAMGPGFALDRLPATRALFAAVRVEEKAAVTRGKAHFQRDRPWVSDATLHPCGDPENPDYSYPSGHATMAFSMASILARLAPAKAPAIMARAADYAEARVVCERHFPSDIIAGQSYGMIIGERLMETPEFRARFDEAAKELKAAGF